MVQLNHLRTGPDGQLPRPVVARADVILRQAHRRILDRVDGDRVRTRSTAHLHHQRRVRSEVGRRRTLPHHEPILKNSTPLRPHRPGQRPGRLLRTVHRQIQHPALTWDDRPVQHLGEKTEPGHDDLTKQGRLADALRPADHQCLTGGPQHVVAVTPDDRRLVGDVEDERRAGAQLRLPSGATFLRARGKLMLHVLVGARDQPTVAGTRRFGEADGSRFGTTRERPVLHLPRVPRGTGDARYRRLAGVQVGDTTDALQVADPVKGDSDGQRVGRLVDRRVR